MATAYERRLSLAVESASDLMSPGVVTIPYNATFADAITLFIDRDLHVALVTDDHGEPIGVLSLTDLLIHVRESLSADGIKPVTVATLMTPTIFSIRADAPADEVVRDMLRSRVHHLFVTDHSGAMQGVVSTCDILCHMKGEARELSSNVRDVSELL